MGQRRYPNIVMQQASAYVSPWSVKVRLLVGIWYIAWFAFCRFTPKPASRWRVLILKIFGAKIEGQVFVAASAKIRMPWNLEMEHRACIADSVEVYNLAKVFLRRNSTLAQYTFLCTGTHDFSSPNLPLVVASIEIGPDAFIGARAFILPGVLVGSGAIVGACSVVAHDVEQLSIVAGNPAKPIGTRVLNVYAENQ